MTQNSNILQELNELSSSLANVAPQNVYTVPSGYFEGLVAQVLNRIRAIEATIATDEMIFLSPLLNTIPKQMPYAVPDGYFEVLQENLMQSVFESNDRQTAKEELETLSPLLSGLKKEMSARPCHSDGPYSVPQGYFDSLHERPVIQETKVISITHRRWFRYAAAAVVTGIIALAGILITVNNNTTDQGKSLAKFDRD
ncbi:MAG TPA: hypothetical protein VN451_04775, partial [Chitinophagaceae bacterium]|nr:hypothetical protein [Chitinophagaceae bacterium]